MARCQRGFLVPLDTSSCSTLLLAPDSWMRVPWPQAPGQDTTQMARACPGMGHQPAAETASATPALSALLVRGLSILFCRLD
jgi:hypothetical protein